MGIKKAELVNLDVYEQNLEVIRNDDWIKSKDQIEEMARECGRVSYRQWKWRLKCRLLVFQRSSFLPSAMFLTLMQGGSSAFMSDVILQVLIALPVVSRKI